MQLPTSSPTSWSDPASTLAPEALLLGGWHTHWRPTTTLQLPPAMFHLCACAHLHLQPDRAAVGPAHPSLPFQHLGQFGPPLAPKAIFPVGWCTHYVPTTSHQPPAIFHTAPAPTHLLRARLHCHIGMCLSIHVSHCLEEFSPQTSPSGIIYPMVGVPSMCPPHPFSHFPTSVHPCGPAFFANLAPSRLAHHLAHPSVHLCTPLRTFAHPCTPLCFTFPGLVTLI